jgi:hypothetical protein
MKPAISPPSIGDMVDVAGSDIAAHARFVVLAQEGAGAFARRFVDDEFEGAGAQQARAGRQVGGVERANQGRMNTIVRALLKR